jgi:hypothetical protein
MMQFKTFFSLVQILPGLGTSGQDGYKPQSAYLLQVTQTTSTSNVLTDNLDGCCLPVSSEILVLNYVTFLFQTV